MSLFQNDESTLSVLSDEKSVQIIIVKIYC